MANLLRRLDYLENGANASFSKSVGKTIFLSIMSDEADRGRNYRCLLRTINAEKTLHQIDPAEQETQLQTHCNKTWKLNVKMKLMRYKKPRFESK